MKAAQLPQRQVHCHPYIKRARYTTRAAGQHTGSWNLPTLLNAYAWPANQPGGVTIAIIELGGGWVQSDMQAFFNRPGSMPTITDVSVDGTQNSQQNPRNDADIEVALDIQVAGWGYFEATGKAASIRVYWAQDIASAITAAAQDGCAICSISWGADEAMWGPQAGAQLEAAATAATAAGMTIFAAAGDNDSSDGGPTPANVDLPAGCPHVIGCGGTTKISGSETVWNNNPGVTNGEGTGGGFSTLFPAQSFQLGAPKAPAGLGRMVPDVTGCADPNTGYQIQVYGQIQVIGGTSAVAPLYAGLFASFGKKLGFVTPQLFQNPAAFIDITRGSNGTYSAFKGPDACSGLGAPHGVSLAALLG
jgi:kumamolisin